MRIELLFRFAVCALLFASVVAAQQTQSPTDPSTILTLQRNQTAQLAATWLHSGDPRLQAWGAYVVLRDKRKELIPDLLALSDEYEVASLPVLSARRPQHDAMLAILDTLIQLDAVVSGDESARVYPEFPAQSLILLSRAGNSSNKIMLEIFLKEHSRLAWLAAGNILAERRAGGFAAAVVGSMTVHMNLLVTDALRGGGGFGEGICGDSGGELPTDRAAWPEIGTYALAEPDRGATLLADGADPAYYRRKVGRLYGDIGGGGECIDPNANSWDLLRQHYVARMLGESRESPPLKTSTYKTIIWENGKAYLAQLRGFVQQQRLVFAETAGKLRDACLMTQDEFAATKPHLEITIVDDREDKSTPLPPAENLGENVTVKM